MLTARNDAGQRVLARDSDKGSNYACPSCKKEMTPKQGEIKIWHFAHKYLGDCWWPSQSEEHLYFKQQLYDLYTRMGCKCELEYIVPGRERIIDLMIVNKKNQKIAIEIQLSSIPAKEIFDRTISLSNLGFYTLWLIGDPALKTDSDRTSGLLYWLHSTLYFGRIYTITKNFTSKIHFDSLNSNFEISALYLTYKTMTIIDKKKYVPITEFNLYCTEVTPEGVVTLKIARFFDKYAGKNKKETPQRIEEVEPTLNMFPIDNE